MNPLRIGFIGAGGISSAHREAFLRYPNRLAAVGVTDPNSESATKFATDLGATVPVFKNHLAMLDALRGRIDGVVINTPHYLHAPMATDVLACNLPVLVEKPVTCTLAELRKLQSLEKPGIFVQAGQMQRFGQEENWIKRWLASPDFGEPRLFNIDIYQNIEGYTKGREDFWILDKRTAGGGIVISVAVHILDLLRYWLKDDFVTVYARGRFDPPLKNGAESTVAATLTTGRGVVGTLNCSYTVARCPYSQRSLIFGTHGSLCQHLDKPGGGYAGAYFTSTDGGKPSREWDLMYSGWTPVRAQMESESDSRNQVEDTAFVKQMLTFANGIIAGKALENSLTRNLNTLATVEAIERSLLSGQPENVETK